VIRSRAMPELAERARLTSGRRAAAPFSEKDFYLEQFRGRSVVVAIAPAATAGRPDLRHLAGAIVDLARNGTRVLLWWPRGDPAAERFLRAALARALRRGRRRTEAPWPPVVRLEAAAPGQPRAEVLRALLWGTLRRERLCMLLAEPAFPRAAATLAVALRVPKLVLIDSGGGLTAGPSRLSFVEENGLEALLREGQAEWSGLGDRRELLAAVREALEGGVETVNLCAPDGIAEELFTYAGSGTLFTRDDYCHLAPLGLDDFAQAERLIERGQREGLLKVRTPDEIAAMLSVAHGAMVCGRHLAGVAGLLTAPYAEARAGEIVGLYTITRFKGEGIGERLVDRLLADAEARGLAYVFACAVDERAMQFFARLGFERVSPDRVPAAKWVGYDARRRARVAVFLRRLTAHTAVRS